MYTARFCGRAGYTHPPPPREGRWNQRYPTPFKRNMEPEIPYPSLWTYKHHYLPVTRWRAVNIVICQWQKSFLFFSKFWMTLVLF